MTLSVVKSQRLSSLWTAGGLRGLLSVEHFQKHMLSYLCALHRDSLVVNQMQQLPYIRWSEWWRGRVERLDVDGMLAQSNCALRVGVTELTNKHHRKGMERFARL